MLYQASLEETEVAAKAFTPAFASPLSVHPLTDADRDEALALLSSGAVDTIYMSGLIRDNGVVSHENRGTFYGARASSGRLEGVALVGHFTLAEARTDEALAAFARLAQSHPRVHMMCGDPDKIERFWRHYGEGGQEPRLICRELFFEQRTPDAGAAPVEGLRRATASDLDLIAPVNARMILDESGVNPLAVDPEGFRARLLHRVECGRVWVWVEGGRLVFKADVIAETPEAIYLEGVHVHPEERLRGYGARCMAQLVRTLLARTESVCLVVNEQHKDAQQFFIKSGFKLRGLYESIYLEQGDDAQGA